MPGQDKKQWLGGLGVQPATLAAIGGAGAAILTAAVDAVTAGALPQPMPSDCKLVHGKVQGPANHVLCSTHGHIVDIKSRTVIAHNLDEYNRRRGARASAHATPGNVEKIDFDADTIEVAPPRGAAMRLPELTAREKAELEKQHKAEAARAKADDARVQQDIHDPKLVEDVISRARTNCANYAIVISDSCRHFTEYADKKVKEFKRFKKAVAPLDLFGAALEFLLSVAGGPLGEGVGKALGNAAEDLSNQIAKEVTKVASDKIKEGIIKQLETEDDSVEALEEAIKQITNKAQDAGEAVRTAVFNTIDKRLSQIAKSLKPPSKDISADDLAMLREFAVNEYDVTLERLGVPSKDTAEASKSKILQGMIQKFEEQRIRAWNAALGDYPGKEALSDREVKHLAESHARDAMREQEEGKDHNESTER
jgi:hypothetical protein